MSVRRANRASARKAASATGARPIRAAAAARVRASAKPALNARVRAASGFRARLTASMSVSISTAALVRVALGFGQLQKNLFVFFVCFCLFGNQVHRVVLLASVRASRVTLCSRTSALMTVSPKT